jgi:hypothetical protein
MINKLEDQTQECNKNITSEGVILVNSKGILMISSW